MTKSDNDKEKDHLLKELNLQKSVSENVAILDVEVEEKE